ncbi:MULTISPECIES: DUF421 domain-containing protein [unclassified Streptomyces]|uniref:DUF421 domain-containing protein n=1 Tax=unclassified Streptomyces TaxID=2593676 RepID=UPI00061E774D|nr:MULTISPECIES: YetF domain-containing protein [unclassified Streptomyces]KJY45993.1 hypothetical protein VR46_11640 [Streptomyces sp. NRRL S-444]KOY58705.1 hypothetical protein ADK59_06935 [Streptomyces sp. XY332]THA39174.1 DUF421 domain-containing protein [Streptomyces sp. A1547]
MQSAHGVFTSFLQSDIPYPEKALRTIAVYALILVLLRIVGKRQLAQLSTFDLVVMLLLANVVQNAVIGPDDSVLGAAFGAAVLLAVNTVVVRAAARYEWLGRLLEGTPTTLARDGHWLTPVIRRCGLRRADLDAAVRHQGGDDVTETTEVTLEPGGTLVVQLAEPEQSADKADIAALRAAIATLERKLDALASGTP